MRKISVIIPAYIPNKEQAQGLKTLLHYLVKEKKPHHEIIVINDGSPYPFAKVSDDNTKFTVIPNGITYLDCVTNKGVAAARNLGLAEVLNRTMLPLWMQTIALGAISGVS